MADTPSQESVVSKPTYTTKETAEAFATLLNNETARNEEPQTSETNVEESNLEQDTAELETEVTDDQIVDNTETESDSQETLYEVTINGVKQQVTLDELTKGYSRESDYTRKTMDLSDQRKEVESMQENLKKELDAVKSSRDQYEVQIGELTKNLNQEENIDWDALYNSDPAQYVRKKAEQDKRKEALLIAQQEQQRINQEKRAEQEKVYQDYIAKERKLLADKLPIYADKDKGKDYVEKLKNFALESGYSQKELDMMVDHRAVLMLDKAFRYNQLQKTKLDKNKVNKPPRIVRSNASNVSEESDVKQRHDRRMNKLKKSGSVRDAQSVLKEMIFNNE
jgi:hypothetical protein